MRESMNPVNDSDCVSRHDLCNNSQKPEKVCQRDNNHENDKPKLQIDSEVGRHKADTHIAKVIFAQGESSVYTYCFQ